jgi:hypothetical protein
VSFISPSWVQEATALAAKSSELVVCAPYSGARPHGQGFNNLFGPSWPSSGRLKSLSWIPFGEFGKILVDTPTLEKVRRSSTPEEPDPDFHSFLGKYRFDQSVSDMADWFVEKGLATEELSVPPNTAVYVKIKPNGSKLQVIADASLRNKALPFKPLNFVLFSCEHAKPILRTEGPTHFFSFDASNFYHAFLLPQTFQEEMPVILRIIARDGSHRALRCLRATFGDSFSPVLTHQALSDLFQVPSTVYEKGRDSKPHPCPWLDNSKDLSVMYIDDLLEASKVLDDAHDRYLFRRSKVAERSIPVKPASIKENVSDIEFAGKRYSGAHGLSFIANTKENSIKLIALTIRLLSMKRIPSTFLKSYIGSLSFGCMHNKIALPYLSELNTLSESTKPDVFLQDSVRFDALLALQFAISPWSPESELRWIGFQDSLPSVVVDASVEHSLVGIFIFVKEKECWRGSFTIPKKFNSSQQMAELYGVFIALKKGEERLGPAFNLISDSISSINSVVRIKMSPSPKTRNTLIRKIVRWAYLKPLRVAVSWVDTDHNIADGPSREAVIPINNFSTFPLQKFTSHILTSKEFFLSSDQFIQR